MGRHSPQLPLWVRSRHSGLALHVCSNPESGYQSADRECPLSAKRRQRGLPQGHQRGSGVGNGANWQKGARCDGEARAYEHVEPVSLVLGATAPTSFKSYGRNDRTYDASRSPFSLRVIITPSPDQSY